MFSGLLAPLIRLFLWFLSTRTQFALSRLAASLPHDRRRHLLPLQLQLGVVKGTVGTTRSTAPRPTSASPPAPGGLRENPAPAGRREPRRCFSFSPPFPFRCITLPSGQFVLPPFLVDTGAARSVFPHQSSTPTSGPLLSAADGNVIRSWGERTLPLQFAGRRFEWTFILADVDRPILGSDFLVYHKLLVDLAGRQLVDSADMSVLPLVSSNSPTSSLFTALLDVPPAYRSLLAEFPDIMGTGFSDLKPKHGVEHHIVTTGQPVFTPARRLDPDKYQAAKLELR